NPGEVSSREAANASKLAAEQQATIRLNHHRKNWRKTWRNQANPWVKEAIQIPIRIEASNTISRDTMDEGETSSDQDLPVRLDGDGSHQPIKAGRGDEVCVYGPVTVQADQVVTSQPAEAGEHAAR